MENNFMFVTKVSENIQSYSKTELIKLLLFLVCMTVVGCGALIKAYVFIGIVVLFGIFWLIMAKPIIGILLIIYTIPIEKIYYYKFFTIKPVIVFTVLTFFAFIIRSLMSKKLRVNKYIAAFALLFLFTTFLSAINAVSLELCIRTAFLYVLGFITIYVIYTYIDSDEKLRFVLKHFIIASFISVLYGYLQYFLYVLFDFNLDKYVFPDALQINSVLYDLARGLHIVPKWVNIGRIAIRANSSFTDPNAFAVYVNLCLAFILATVFYYLKKGYMQMFAKSFILLLAFCGAVLISVSRTAILSLLFMLVVALLVCFKRFCSPKMIFFLLLFVGAAYLCFILFHHWFSLIFMDRLNDLLSISSRYERVVAAKAALEMFSSHPFIGIGAYNYGQIYGRFYDQGYLTMSPHNTYLAILSETGLCGMFVFLYFLYMLYNMIKKYIKRVKDYDEEVIGYGLLVGFFD